MCKFIVHGLQNILFMHTHSSLLSLAGEIIEAAASLTGVYDDAVPSLLLLTELKGVLALFDNLWVTKCQICVILENILHTRMQYRK